MNQSIDTMLQQYETGKVSRRELIQGLSALAAATAVVPSSAQESEPVFEATRLNHIALRVTDVQRSRDFYKDMLNMTPTRDTENSCFMTYGNCFTALFQGDEPKMDHYCYSIKTYNIQDAAKKLRERGIEPRIAGNRIYFPDPDGIEVQLAADDHTP